VSLFQVISRLLLTVFMAEFFCVSCAKTVLPRPFIVPEKLQLIDLWSQASIVATGEIRDAKRIGNPEPIVQPDGSHISVYPCAAVFSSTTIIKGRPGKENVLWFSYFPNCTFEHYRPMPNSVQKIWFLRSSGGWLRPITDNTRAYLELFQPFDGGVSQSQIELAFARILLTPDAIAQSRQDFAGRLIELHSLACTVAGKPECFRLLADLQMQDPRLRGDICRYLGVVFNQCRLSDCTLEGIPGLPRETGLPLQATRRSAELHEISEATVRSLLNSADAAKRRAVLSRLQVLSCNIEPVVSRGAAGLLRKFFPGEQPIPCVPCK